MFWILVHDQISLQSDISYNPVRNTIFSIRMANNIGYLTMAIVVVMLFIITPTLTPNVDLEGRNIKTSYRKNNMLIVYKT